MKLFNWRKFSLASSMFLRAVKLSARWMFWCGFFLIQPIFLFASEAVIEFNIPRQRADLALIEFALQTNETLLFPFDRASTKQSNRLVGTYTKAEGLSQLLEGTDLVVVPGEQGQLNIGIAKELNMKHKDAKASFIAQLSSAVAILLGTQAATADDQPASRPMIEEVVVTARFRKESVQTVGGSISATSGQTIAREGLTDFEDIARRTVGLDLVDRGPNQNDLAMRGVSNGVTPGLADSGGSAPLVSQFLDDLPVTSSTGSQRDFNFFDFERIEVLRGPQPTLFGEGSMGGTIRYVTREPKLEEGSPSETIITTRLSSTTDGGTNKSISGASSIVLVPDVLAIRGVLNYRDDDGFIDNPVLGIDDINDNRSVSARIVALYQPTDALSLRLSIFSGRDDVGEPNVVDSPKAADELEFSSAIDGTSVDDFDLYSLKVAYDMESVTLTSITGLYQRQSRVERYDNANSEAFGTFLPVSLSGTNLLDTDDDSFTQEFRLVSNLSGPVNFVAGAYYRDDKLVDNVGSTAPELIPFVTSPVGGDVLFNEDRLSKSKQTSVFAEVTYALTDSLRLIGGVRYVDAEVAATTTRSEFALGATEGGLGPPFVIFDSGAAVEAAGLPSREVFRLKKWLPRVSVEYDLGESTLLYGIVSSGIRAGNLNPAVTAFFFSGGDPDIFRQARSFDEDQLVSMEIGLKTRWLEDALTTNVAVYRINYDNPQVQMSVPFVMTQNGPDERIYGFELENFWQPSGFMSMYLNLAYQHGEFVQNALLVPAAGTLVTFDVPKGNEPVNAPKWSVATGVTMNYPLGSSGFDLVADIGYQFIDDRYSAVQNFPSSLLHSNEFLNLRVGVENEKFGVVGFVTNATNEVQFQSIFGNAGAAKLNAQGQLDYSPSVSNVNRPRTVGIELTYHP